MKNSLKKFLNDEAGLETVEYAIIAGLIVAGLVAVVTSIGAWVNGQTWHVNGGATYSN